jgi:hypothetical protein
MSAIIIYLISLFDDSIAIKVLFDLTALRINILSVPDRKLGYLPVALTFLLTRSACVCVFLPSQIFCCPFKICHAAYHGA